MNFKLKNVDVVLDNSPFVAAHNKTEQNDWIVFILQYQTFNNLFSHFIVCHAFQHVKKIFIALASLTTYTI